jgi:hypothetical protein
VTDLEEKKYGMEKLLYRLENDTDVIQKIIEIG